MRILTGVVQAGTIALDPGDSLPDGTRVTIILDEDEVACDDIAIREFSDPAPEPTVLVVEDDPDLNEIFEEILAAAGYRVVTACDGRDALRYLERSRERPHAILLDVRMPNMDGITFRREAAKVDGLAGVPVIMTSADTNVRAEIAALDVAAFLPKPVERSELVATVSRVCDDDED